MSLKTISIAITGSGGSGVMTAGQNLLNAVSKAGYYGLMARSLGPQIRGGEAAALIRISEEEIQTQGDFYDILFAFDWDNVSRFKGELPVCESSIVMCDENSGNIPEFITDKNPKIIKLPLNDLAKETPDGRANMVCLGILAEAINLDSKFVHEIISIGLKKKGAEVIDNAISCINSGYNKAKELNLKSSFQINNKDKSSNLWSITGNEGIGFGAIKGGIKFVAAYPITPATSILEWMAPNLEKVGGTLVQAEDELAAMNMILGASFGGVPSLTATSGPGLALMLEGFGLGISSEMPVVVVDVQRGGPSTGIPTKSEQCDLNIALYGAHGDAPHLVVAANSISDCILTSQWTVHLSETLQTPAILLSDQFMGQARVIINEPTNIDYETKRLLADENSSDYKRYKVTENGISPMAVPGIAGGEHTADGLEHDETGRPSTDADNHLKQLEKRNRKLTSYDYGDMWADISGSGDTAIITFGSITGAVKEALEDVDGVKLVSVRLISPIQPEKMNKALDGVKKAIVIEQNHGAQFYKFLKGNYDLDCKLQSFARPGPLPIKPAEIKKIIKDWRE